MWSKAQNLRETVPCTTSESDTTDSDEEGPLLSSHCFTNNGNGSVDNDQSICDNEIMPTSGMAMIVWCGSQYTF